MSVYPGLSTTIVRPDFGKLGHGLSMAKIAMLPATQHPHQRTLQLFDRLGIESSQVYLCVSLNESLDCLADCDLILFELFGPVNDEMMALLLRIRTISHAPLVGFTHSSHSDRTIRVLQAGADAVLSFSLPDKVVAAHLTSLVQRWWWGRSACRTVTVSH